ncbi:serine/threonine protein kinase [Streptomyces cellostaticus]|uniref:non-specific serine/threonine protein kinase n=1 Tax=Streptomyces cellostaticus TaxID=67285 RepID=A0A101NPE8_9ACTN|nr:serine/threonine-protein kinase [Streptomyces cellostaticus]KUM96676.1 serine/threonine protein kinase [Streptomyces cellostaticus]
MQGLLIAGRYRLADSIGSGGMGRVWRAHDEVLHRKVAVKELTAALYVSESDQAVLLARTRAEARAAARINHSAVVTVHDVLEHDGRPWIVMELVEGHSLADAVKERGRIEQREAARIGLWVLRALRAAHSAGVLHRDVKPGNVLLGRDGRVLLTDFGIAQIEGDTTITRTGEVVGSVDYLAPERVRGHDPGPSSDLWALGATLYTAVEGRSPFRRTSPLSTMQAVVEEEVEEPRHAGPLGPVIAALLCKEPAQRPGAEEAEQMLAEAAEGRRPHTAQAFIPTQGSGMDTSGSYTSGSYTSGSYGSEPYASGAGTSGYGSGPAASGYGSGAAAQGYGSGPGASGRSATGPTTVAPTAAGPSSVGPTTIGPTSAGPRTAPARPRRRRLRTLALVVAVAAVLGGGAAVAFQQWGSFQQESDAGGATPAPATSAKSTSGQEGAVPDDWERKDDPLGFSLSLPKGWKRKVYSNDGALKQIDYSPDGGKHFVRIAIDTNPDFADAFQHQKDLEQQLQRLVGYQRVAMEENTYRDRKGSLWEYTWTALKKDPPHVPGPRHAIEETYYSREGVEYAIYMSSPAADWAKTSKQFKWVLQSWQPPNAG